MMKKLINSLSVGAAVWLAASVSLAQDNPGAADAAAPLAGAGGFGMEPPFSGVRVVNAGAGIPVGGVLLIYAGGSSVAPNIAISDVATPSTTLGGTLKMLLGQPLYWVWVPTKPLTAGTTYQILLSSPDFGGPGEIDTFEVVPALTLARPAISAAPSASWRGDTHNTACCRSLLGGVLQETSCFPIEQRASIVLDPGFATSEPAVLMNQFVFRISTQSSALSTVTPSVWPNLPLEPVLEQAEEYCFAIEAIDIATETVFSYGAADLALCAPHGELSDLGVNPIEPGATELDRLVCHAPPEPYTEAWCELNEDPCADDAMATACGLYGFVCRDEPLPPDPFSMTGGFDGSFGGSAGMFGASGVGGIGGAGEGGTGATTAGTSGMPEGGVSGDEGNDDGSSGSGSWCSVAMVRDAQRSTPALAVWLSALALIGGRLSRPSRRIRSRAKR